jgi:hypothetical protein
MSWRIQQPEGFGLLWIRVTYCAYLTVHLVDTQLCGSSAF